MYTVNQITIMQLATGLESLALTLLPSPRSNPDAVLDRGARMESFGLGGADDRPPLREGLERVQQALSAIDGAEPAAQEVGRMIALLSVHIMGRPPGFAEALGYMAMVAAGQLRRLQG